MLISAQPNHVKAALASMAASMLLILAPFALPNFPLAPLLAINWVLFISVGYFAVFRPFSWKTFIKKPERRKVRWVNFALITFIFAGWIAVYNAKRMF